MSPQEPNSIFRYLRILKNKGEPGPKHKTIKKAAPAVESHSDQTVQNEQNSVSRNRSGTFPVEYYVPRPIPKSFVVAEVRKVSNNVNPLDSLRSQNEPSNSEITSSKHTGASKASSTQPKDPSSSSIPSLRSTSWSDSGPASSSEKSGTSNNKPLINGIDRTERQISTFHLLVGRQDPDSQYFSRRYFSLPDFTQVNDASMPSTDALHHIAELDPQAFEMYKIYMHTGKIGFRSPESIRVGYMWIAYWPLMNAHILGCIVEESEFSDRAIDLMAEKLTLGVWPDIDTVKHLFDDDRKSIPMVLKQFVIDRFIYAQQQSSSILETSDYPISFRLLAFHTAMQRLSAGSSTIADSGCKYHVHGTSEACYKTKLTPVDTLRERRFAEAREMFAKDAKVVVADITRNGVQSVDWEQRRADANRALREETGKPWIDLKKLEGTSSLEKSGAPHHNTGLINNSVVGKDHSVPVQELYDTASRTNGIKPNFNLAATSNNPRVIRSGYYSRNSGVTNLPVMKTSSELPGFDITTSHTKLSSHNLVTLAPAELHGSTVQEMPGQTDTGFRCKPSVNQALGTRGRTSQALVVVTGAQDTSKSSSSSSTLTLEPNVNKLVTGWNRGVDCPGAYPESNESI